MGMTMSQKILAAHCGEARSGRASSSTPSWTSCSATTSPPRWPSMSSKKPGLPRSLTKRASTSCSTILCPTRTSRARRSPNSAENSPTNTISCTSTTSARWASSTLCCPKKASSRRATASSAPTATPAPTARWGRSLPAAAPPIWPPAWPPACCGSRCRPPSRSCSPARCAAPSAARTSSCTSSGALVFRGRCTKAWSSPATASRA